MKKQNQIKRFKILFFLVQSLGVEKLMEQMEMLAHKVDEGDKQVDAALDYFEDAILNVLDDEKRIDDADDIIKKVFKQ